MSIAPRRVGTLVLACLALGYGGALLFGLSHRHLRVPPGSYGEAIEGRYEITARPLARLPAVFAGGPVEITRGERGRLVVVGPQGERLPLVEGGDGHYFSADFSPGGAWILPGFARNWNEGRIYRAGDVVVVDGVMLEIGLALFVIPFEDVASWRIELERSEGPAVEPTARRYLGAPDDPAAAASTASSTGSRPAK